MKFLLNKALSRISYSRCLLEVKSKYLVNASFALLLFFLFQCSPFDPGMGFGYSRFSVYYTDPGSDRRTGIDKKIDSELVELIDSAEISVRLAVYNFSLESIVQAIIRAKNRRLDVKVVGDIDEFYTHGYQAMDKENVDMHLGNATGIQHNKFAVIDQKKIFVGTGNMTTSDFVRNNNNFYIIEHEGIAKTYEAEFMQMYNGLFASKKKPRTLNQKFNINEGSVEIFFSPYQGEEAMNSLIGLVNEAKSTIHYMIFAYTHDELASSMIQAARQRNILVKGVHDSTFIIGVSEEAPRLYSSAFNNDLSQNIYGPFSKIDGNENTLEENNPVHGGKMHAKTMIIDAGTDHAVLATGSFNWSTNAIDNNDENMMIIRDARVANAIYEQWQGSWEIGQDMSEKIKKKNGQTSSLQQVVISEVNWAGSKDNNTSSLSVINESDDYLELYNRTASPIDISHWSIQWGCDQSKNIYPIPDQYNWYYTQDNVLNPGEHVIFYNLTDSAFGIPTVLASGADSTAPHFKFSGTKGFSLSSAEFKIRLYDKSMNLIDEAGDCQSAPAGVQDNQNKKVASMQRRDYKGLNIQNGSKTSAWYTAFTGCESSLNPNCLDFEINTYGTPGYNNGDEIGPNTLNSRFLNSTQLELDFDSNMSSCLSSNYFIFRKEGLGAFTSTNISLDSNDTGKIIIDSASFLDQTKMFEILPVGVFHKVAINGAQIVAATNSGLAISTDLTGSSFNYYTRISNAGVLTTLPSPRINSLAINGANIYLATANGLIVSDLSGNFSAPTIYYPQVAINDLIFSNTTLYVATENGLFYSNDSFASSSSILTTVNGLPSNQIKKIFLVTGSPNKLILATNNGLAILDTSNNLVTVKTVSNGLPSNIITSIYYDTVSIFAGTPKGFVRSLDGITGDSWSSVYTTISGLPSNQITAFYSDTSTWLVGTDKGLAYSNNSGSSFTIKNSTSGLKGIYINNILVNAGKIYLSTMSSIAISNDFSAGHNYTTFNVCSDYTNVFSPTNYVFNTDFGFYFNGYNNGNNGQQAILRINEVAMQRSNDAIELYATSSGSLRGISIYKYNSTEKTLLYKFNEAYIQAGDFILLELKHSYEKALLSEDKTLRKSSANLMKVFSTYKGLDGTEDIIFITDQNNVTQDFLFYSNQNGDIDSTMMTYTLRDVYRNYQSFWALPELPTEELNDALIESYGINISNVNSSTRGIQRTCNGTGIWEYSDTLTLGSSNLSPNC